jgi:hypothetical protein
MADRTGGIGVLSAVGATHASNHFASDFTCLVNPNHRNPGTSFKGTFFQFETSAAQNPWLGFVYTSCKTTARCSFFDRNLHSLMPLDPTHVRLRLLHACDQ